MPNLYDPFSKDVGGRKGIQARSPNFMTSMSEIETPPSGRNPILPKVLEYGAMAASLLGGLLLIIPHWGAFLLWIAACVQWIWFGCIRKHWGLVITQVFFLVINFATLYRVAVGAWHG